MGVGEVIGNQNFWRAFSRVFLMACLSPIILTSCGGGGSGGGTATSPTTTPVTGTSNPYFPFSVGDSWVYRIDNTGAIEAVVVKEIRAIQGKSYAVLVTTDESGSTTETYLRSDGSGVSELLNNGSGYQEVRMLPPSLTQGTQIEQSLPDMDLGEDLDGDGINERGKVDYLIKVGAPSSTASLSGATVRTWLVTTLATFTGTYSSNAKVATATVSLEETYGEGIGVMWSNVSRQEGSMPFAGKRLVGYRVGGSSSIAQATTLRPGVVNAEGERQASQQSIKLDLNGSVAPLPGLDLIRVYDKQGQRIPGKSTWTLGNYVFVADKPFAIGESLTLRVNDLARDYGGNPIVIGDVKFVADNTGPSVIKVTPSSGAEVAADTAVQVEFDEDIFVPGQVYSNFGLYLSDISDAYGDFARTWVATSTRAVRTDPATFRLPAGLRYTLRFTGGIADAFGNRSSAPQAFSFSTHFGLYSVMNALPNTFGDYPALSVKDLNGDGFRDLVGISGSMGQQVIDIRYQLARSFDPPRTISLASIPACLANAITSGDLNGDGLVDIAVGYGGCALKIFTQGAGGNFVETASISDSDTERLEAIDLNGDGKLELVGFDPLLKRFSVWSMASNGSVTKLQAHAFMPNTTGDVRGRFFADLNGDGRLDILGSALFAPVNEVMGIAYQNADGSFASTQFVASPAGTNPAVGAVSDVDRDGKADIVLLGGSPSNDYSIGYLSQLAGGGFSAWQMLFPMSTTSSQRFLDLRDIDGNGMLDLIYDESQLLKTMVYLQRSPGVFETVEMSQRFPGGDSNLNSKVSVDLDGDGLMDYVNNRLQVFFGRVQTPSAAVAGGAVKGVSASSRFRGAFGP